MDKHNFTAIILFFTAIILKVYRLRNLPCFALTCYKTAFAI